MSTTDDNTRRLLAYLAAAAVAGGQPVHEVESDTRRVAARLGHRDVQVGATPSGIIVSLGQGTPATYESINGSLRLDQSADTAAVRAGLLDGSVRPDEALARLSHLRATPHRYPRGGLEGGMLCVATGIALILQPLWPSVLFAALAGQVTAAFIRFSGKWRSLATLTPFLAAFVIALAAFAAAQAGLIEGPLRSLLPPIAVLLPGALVVTGVSELAAGQMTAGTSRLAFGSAQLLLFALGVAGAAWLLRVPSTALTSEIVNEIGPWSPFVGVLLLTAGISLMESVPPRLVPWVALMLSLTLSFQVFGQSVVGSPWSGALLGATAASLGAALVELYRPQLPRLVMFLPSFWLLVPGSLGVVSVTQLGLEPSLAVDTTLQAASIVSAIALGLLIGTSVARMIGLLRQRRLDLMRRHRARRSH
ncbi:threonine/serine exporter family protein [Mobilicoccus massiliensis]|uniref:threonine/serine ThrE exporter family protein n=1 Tax=Mobilicoccus massiliensis TaxID=1522310 RepID=UPI000590CEDE|nr:threonine/serine exporter family protein [Mobilicoccus massiliensis]